MAKTLTEAKITTREQRKKLAPDPKPYWRSIDQEVHLGYRKGKRGGTWVVREYLGKVDGYRHTKVGTADDEISEGTLDFNAAVKRAKELVADNRRNDRATLDGPAISVCDVVEAYMAERDARDSRRKGREARSDARSRLSRYVSGLPARGRRKAVPASDIASVALHDLTLGHLQAWRAGLPDKLKANTKQRLINDLKAALNAACTVYHDRLPPALVHAIKHGLRADVAPENEADAAVRDDQILSNAEVGRLLEIAREVDAEQGMDGDLFRLFLVLAGTGARFSQAARLRVADVQTDKGRLVMPVSRKGRAGKSGSTNVPVAEDVMEELLPAVRGRAKNARLLEKWKKKQIAGTIRWERVGRGPWQSSSEINRAWDVIRKRAEMPHLVPYALRYSSIVRGIQLMPIRLVAALHDTSVTMIERHYGRYIADGLDELAARSVTRLVPATGQGKVVRLATA